MVHLRAASLLHLFLHAIALASFTKADESWDFSKVTSKSDAQARCKDPTFQAVWGSGNSTVRHALRHAFVNEFIYVIFCMHFEIAWDVKN